MFSHYHDHLRDMVGEKVHIISMCVSGQIKEGREKDIDPSKYRHIVQHVNSHLQQDMVNFASLSFCYQFTLQVKWTSIIKQLCLCYIVSTCEI
jgi:hypothetical protein